MRTDMKGKAFLNKCLHLYILVGMVFIIAPLQTFAVDVKISDTLGFSNGQNVQIPIVTGNLNGLDVYSYYIRVTFDPSIISCTGVSKTGTLTSPWSAPTINTSIPGEISIAAYGAYPLTGIGALLYLKFLVVGAAGSGTILSFASFMYNEGTPSVTLTNGSLIIGNVPLPVPTITGPASVCVASTGNVYNTETGMTGYTWVVSSGGTITAGSGTNQITITWNTIGAQTVSVNYTNGSGLPAPEPTVKDITVYPRPMPTITGTSTVCIGTIGVTYATESTMTGYIWAVSSGGTITAGSGTNQITVTWNTSGAKTVSVNYTNPNSCAAASATVKNITVNPLPVASGYITGASNVLQGQTGVAYSVGDIANTTGYSWTLPGGAGITAGNNTNSILVSFSPTATSGVMRVAGTNSCGSGAWSPEFSITVSPAVPATKTITNQIVASGQVKCYDATQVITVAGNGTIFFILTGGTATFIAGQKISFLPGTTVQSGGSMWGYIAPNGPYCTNPSMPAVVTTNDEIPVDIEQSSFKIYPNPTTGIFSLELTGEASIGNVAIEIYGIWGEKVITHSLTGERKHEFSLSDKPVGVYFVRVISGNKAETVKIIKQ